MSHASLWDLVEQRAAASPGAEMLTDERAGDFVRRHP
jgi:hypothetical protein